MKIRVHLNPRSIQEAIRKLNDYTAWLERKGQELCERLATMGALKASLEYSGVFYTGPKNYNITVEPMENGYKIIADGESVLFLEFGAGMTYGYGHPKNAEFGMGPGTYPPTGPEHPHWNDPNGWYIPGGEHTYGNPPAMGMYLASKEMREEVERIAREVFASD